MKFHNRRLSTGRVPSSGVSVTTTATTSPETLATLATWLDEPCHLKPPKPTYLLEENESLHFLLAVSETLNNSDCESSPLLESSDCGDNNIIEENTTSSTNIIQQQELNHHQKQEDQLLKGAVKDFHRGLEEKNKIIIGHQLPAHLDHKSVDTLLTEYYKLIEVAKKDKNSTNCYQPMMLDKIMDALTAMPPEVLHLISLFKTIIKLMVVLSGYIIKMVLFRLCPLLIAVWLSLVYYLYLSSASLFFVLFAFSFGLLVFSLAEQFYYHDQLEDDDIIYAYKSSSTINKNEFKNLNESKFHDSIIQSQISIDDPLKNIQDHKEVILKRHVQGIVASSSLSPSSSAYPQSNKSTDSHLTNPPHSSKASVTVSPDIMTEINQDLIKIRQLVTGEESNVNSNDQSKLPKSKNKINLNEFQTQIKEVCSTVGVECLEREISNYENIKTKLKELKELVGC